ncbi:hypothetical protein [Acinetobacter sp. NIPH 298]|uniref:hypothetical protein n=1 Tax=Acinetobacter sp. NIPH 298 TaxID=1217692 RepID=UPI0002CF9E27|nr:hypothetical protein [Acinetobacter sp. NIPH 298]ENW95975.1 hypothetical protein F903_01743 [Acinetobacter sp. NIPH 298]
MFILVSLMIVAVIAIVVFGVLQSLNEKKEGVEPVKYSVPVPPTKEQNPNWYKKQDEFYPTKKVNNTGFYDYTKPEKTRTKASINIEERILSQKKFRIEYDCSYDFDSYPFDIVGEASYQNNIQKFAVLRRGKGSFTEVEAKIVREPCNSFDKNACRVDINGLTVGYFARNHAESWVRLLSKLNIGDTAEIYADAVITGGKDGSKFGVRLNIPSRIANTAKYFKDVN